MGEPVEITGREYTDDERDALLTLLDIENRAYMIALIIDDAKEAA
jgi:hypothetical protein